MCYDTIISNSNSWREAFNLNPKNNIYPGEESSLRKNNRNSTTKYINIEEEQDDLTVQKKKQNQNENNNTKYHCDLIVPVRAFIIRTWDGIQLNKNPYHFPRIRSSQPQRTQKKKKGKKPERLVALNQNQPDQTLPFSRILAASANKVSFCPRYRNLQLCCARPFLNDFG